MKPLRLHVLGLPHTVTHHDYVACAYTQKVLKFCHMMRSRGHYVIHYGHEDSIVDCDEHVRVTDNQVLEATYGDHDWRRHEFKHNINDHANATFNQRAIPEIRVRAQQGDFLCCSWGIGHQSIAKAVEPLGVIPVENGIGYTSGHFARWRAYESHAVRTAVEGPRSPQNWYSWVIPNYFDLDDFTYQANKEDFILYLGRITELKGVSVAVQATAAAGKKLIMAGQGSLLDLDYTSIPGHVTELGYADREMRRDLMSRASALIIASSYLEPFGGVQVEALLSGTPIITPFYGAFAEVNQHNVTGFQCHNLREYVDAIKSISRIRPMDCRARGLQYSFDAVAPQFESWFESIRDVYFKKGWSEL